MRKTGCDTHSNWRDHEREVEACLAVDSTVPSQLSKQVSFPAVLHTYPERPTEFDWDLVNFVVQWARYGGPDPEEVLPKFGMTCARLRERLEQIVGYARRHTNRVSREQTDLVVGAERWLSTLDARSPFGTPVDGAPSPVDPLGAPGQPTLSRGVWRWQ